MKPFPIQQFGGRREAGSDEDFFTQWDALQARLAALLRAPQQAGFLPEVKACVSQLVAWGERFADPLLFVVVQHDHGRHQSYGAAHLLHSAAICAILSRRLAWCAERQHSIVGAALTMNLSIIDLQGSLASSGGRLSPLQRTAIDRHPDEAVAWLRGAGLDDAEWLAAVAQHHEQPGGGGYPQGTAEPGETAQLLRIVDIFLAKLASRGGRAGLTVPQAAKAIYVQTQASAFAALLVKELGLYPPGTVVRLASGETAVAVHRGTTGDAPVVHAVLDADGDALDAPIHRDTAHVEHAIVGIVALQDRRFELDLHRLYAPDGGRTQPE